MCIIVAKVKGVKEPSFETLKTCFEANPDGAGFMYLNPKNKKVQIHKGFMKFEDLKAKLTEVYNELGDIKDIPFVYHFRIGTSGGNLPENTHPYPLTKNIDNMKKLDFTCDIGVAHNGVISKYTPNKDNKKNMNDTQVYIRKRMYKYAYLFKYRNEKVKDNILKETGSKFAILDGTGNIELIGSFNENQGIYYSNFSWKEYDWVKAYNDTYNTYKNMYSSAYNGYDCSYGDEKFKTFQALQEAISYGKFLTTDKVLFDYMYDEALTIPDNWSYIELDGIIYYVDYDNKQLVYITDWYDVLDEDDIEDEDYERII